MIETLTPTIQPRMRRWRFDVAGNVRLYETGIIPEAARTELVEGEIRIMAPIGPEHGSSVITLNMLFAQQVRQRALVSPQNSLQLGDRTMFQPDIVLLRPDPRAYRDRYPEAADVLLVVEVARTSLRYDRNRKVPLYGRHGIAEVWLADLAHDVLEVYREPTSDGYARIERLAAGDVVTPLAMPDVHLEVAASLGAAPGADKAPRRR